MSILQLQSQVVKKREELQKKSREIDEKHKTLVDSVVASSTSDKLDPEVAVNLKKSMVKFQVRVTTVMHSGLELHKIKTFDKVWGHKFD